jgi:glycosyltransferase involved in cell wall biosynthesis
MTQDTWIVIPAYNESTVIASVILEIQKSGYQNILVIDDGSSDDTQARARAMSGVIALKHLINRGKGAAVKTGIEAAKKLGA